MREPGERKDAKRAKALRWLRPQPNELAAPVHPTYSVTRSP